METDCKVIFALAGLFNTLRQVGKEINSYVFEKMQGSSNLLLSVGNYEVLFYCPFLFYSGNYCINRSLKVFPFENRK
jgi:hypothetical protein